MRITFCLVCFCRWIYCLATFVLSIVKVLRGGSTEEKPEGKTAETDTTDVLEDEKNLLYGKRLDDSILYECNELPSRINVYEESPVPDNSLAYVSDQTLLFSFDNLQHFRLIP